MDIAKALGNISLFYTDEREVNFCTRRAMGECVRLAASIKIIIFFNSAQREMFIFCMRSRCSRAESWSDNELGRLCTALTRLSLCDVSAARSLTRCE